MTRRSPESHAPEPTLFGARLKAKRRGGVILIAAGGRNLAIGSPLP